MTIGENIRTLRKKLNLTQAQLADTVGVTVQAISKWETEAGMPDISQIIPLARALGVTTDQLLHYEDKKQEYKKRWEAALRQGCDHEQLLAISKAILDEDPENTEFLFRAAMDAEFIARECTDERQQHFHRSMSLRYTNQLLKLDPGHESAKEHLVTVYSGLGMDDEAIAAAYRCKNSSRALLWCLKGEALRRHRQKRIEQKFQSLLNEIDQAGMPEVTEALIRAAVPDGNYQHYGFFLFSHGWDRAKVHYAAGNEDAAMVELQALFALARKMDECRAHPQFTAPVFDLLEGFRNPPGVPSFTEQFIHECQYLFPQLQHREDHKQLMADAMAYLNRI